VQKDFTKANGAALTDTLLILLSEGLGLSDSNGVANCGRCAGARDFWRITTRFSFTSSNCAHVST
jgi:hypothetical protein